MAAVSGSIQYDQVTGQDLFDSFMDIVLTEGGDIDNDLQLNITTASNSVNKQLNSDDMKLSGSSSPNVENNVPLPLHVKLQEPIYATCYNDSSMKVRNVNESNSITNEETKSAIEASYAVVDKTIIGRETNVKEVDLVVEENSAKEIPNVNVDNRTNEKGTPKTKTDMSKNQSIKVSASQEANRNNYGNVKIPQNKTSLAEQENRYDDVVVEKYNPSSPKLDVADQYAVIDKSKQDDKTIYADVAVVRSNNDNMRQPVTESEYTNVIIKSPTSTTNTEYETISHYKHGNGIIKNEEPKMDIKNETNTVYDAKQIACSGPRFGTAGQNELYKSIASTIERGNTQLSPRSATSSGKRKFFGLGSRKSSGDHTSSDNQTNSQRWSAVNEFNYMDGKTGKQSGIKRQSSIPIICSGYLYKQGGTGFTPKNWRVRWFELKKDNCLYYYKSEQDQIPSGAVMLLKYSAARAAEVNKKFAFKLMKGGARTYFFAANSEEEMKKWMKNLGESARYAVSDHTSIPECSLKNVSIPALSITEPDCHGFLWKQGNSHKSWKKRYCVLKYGCVFYYEEMSNEVAIGVFKLHNHKINLNKNVKYGIEAEPPLRKMRTYQFYAENEMDFNRWFEAMKHSISTFH